MAMEPELHQTHRARASRCPVTTVYILISLVFLYLVPPGRIDSRETFAALTGEALLGRAGGVVLSLIVVVTVLGSLAALLMAMSRVYFAMARRPVLPNYINRVADSLGIGRDCEGSKAGTLLTGLPSRAGPTPPRSVA